MSLVVTSAPWQEVDMPALDLRRYIDALVSAEGLATASDLQVTQRGAGANMSVDISAGAALIQGDTVTGQGVYLAYNDAIFNLTGFTAAHATLPRVDRVVIRVRDHYHGDPANDVSFQILTGTATSGATLANLNGAAAVGNSQLLLANILVPATATTITTANIANVAPLLGTATRPSYRKATAKTVNTSSAETDLLNGEITIPANVLGQTGMLRLTVVVDHLFNVAFGPTVRYRLKFGATTLWDSGALTCDAQSATRYAVQFEATIHNLTTASQVSQGTFAGGNARILAPAVGIVTGTASFPGATADTYGWVGVAATEDTTTSKVLQLTVQHSDTGGAHESKLYAALVEIL